MDCIKPLASLSRDEIAELAHNAADNEVPLPRANVFPVGSEQHAWFMRAYWDRDSQLHGCEA